MTINVMIKTLDGARTPSKATEGSAGLDLSAYEDTFIYPHDCQLSVSVRTGVYVEIPPGYVGILAERSSLKRKHGLTLNNNLGIIDSDYRGEILIELENTTDGNIRVERGQRIAQLVIVPNPEINLINVDGLNETKRGTGAFGSSGN